MAVRFRVRLRPQPSTLLALFLVMCGSFFAPTTLPMVGTAEAQRYAEFIPDDFILFWPSPVRAHPNVPVRFRFSVYEMNNQPLTWRLTNAPAGMTLANDGRVTFTPTSAQVGSYNVTVRVTRADGVFRERTFPVTVGTSSFFFVSTSGSDTNPGTISQPFRTLLKAFQSVQNGVGKTIVIRGGTYRETYNWEVNGVYSPLRDKYFSANDPLEITGYPGETAILDCQLQGHGFWFINTSYVSLDNVTVVNAGASERAGIMVGSSSNVMIRDTIVHSSNWTYRDNCSGYSISSGDTVLDGTIAYSNRDPSTPDSWNSANYLFYLDLQGGGDAMYAIGAKAWDSVAGFKIKHSGPKKLILHSCEAFDHTYGYLLGSSNSSVRYSYSLNNHTGLQVGAADPNAYTTGAILVDHNTFVNSPGTAFNLQDTYSLSAPTILTNNIFANTLTAAGEGEADARLLQIWIYDSAATTHPIISDHNLFFSPSQANIVRLGFGTYKATSFSTWRTLGHDTNSVFQNPLFANVAQGDFNLPANSPAGFADGSYVGNLRPGQTTSLVGVRLPVFPPPPPTGVRVQQTN